MTWRLTLTPAPRIVKRRGGSLRMRFDVRQEPGEQPDRRQERTHLEDDFDAGRIGESSQHRSADTADARIRPMTTVRISVHIRFAYGRSSVNGSTPRIETQITYLRPIRSPTGPPMNVPAAAAPSSPNRCSCALCTVRLNLWIK